MYVNHVSLSLGDHFIMYPSDDDISLLYVKSLFQTMACFKQVGQLENVSAQLKIQCQFIKICSGVGITTTTYKSIL